ncbi:hypothetical protein [Mycolicibacterium tusciae]|uniref:hypothetical protein n=1 Tax=Mycolicibacterium tusciae TaxID=75922 RepID=UPI00024A3AA3|nr:hypothetical protein [Mycolicibacterium tusciae]
MCRDVSVIEIREVLRARLAGRGLRVMVAAVRPDRPQSFEPAWNLSCGNHDRISKRVDDELTVVKIGDLLARQGVMVPLSALHRYCQARTSYAGRRPGGTVPVVDGDPGTECQIDFARMGMLFLKAGTP